jgi:hypothetical protein
MRRLRRGLSIWVCNESLKLPSASDAHKPRFLSRRFRYFNVELIIDVITPPDFPVDFIEGLAGAD